MTSDSSDTFIAAVVKEKLNQPGLTKRTAVRLSIAQAIDKGLLLPGDSLPTERDLVEICGVSLGTVQAALTQLEQFDLIERRRGSGNRVRRKSEVASQDVWHFRFLSKQTGEPLRALSTDPSIEVTSSLGDWSNFLGKSDAYICIRRLLDFGEDCAVFAEMFMKPDTAPRLVQLEPENLKALNIRTFLREEYSIQTSYASHTVETTEADEEDIINLRVSKGDLLYLIEARAFSQSGMPVYFQRIFAPIDRCKLVFVKN